MSNVSASSKMYLFVLIESFLFDPSQQAKLTETPKTKNNPSYRSQQGMTQPKLNFKPKRNRVRTTPLKIRLIL